MIFTYFPELNSVKLNKLNTTKKTSHNYFVEYLSIFISITIKSSRYVFCLFFRTFLRINLSKAWPIRVSFSMIYYDKLNGYSLINKHNGT